MKIILIFMLFLDISYTFSNEKSDRIEITKEVQLKLGTLRSLPAEDFVEKVDEYRDTLSKYIKYKKLVCQGEFSAIVLDGSSEVLTDKSKMQVKKKLSVLERQLCFRELKAIQFTFINNLFVSRKRYLKHSYEVKVEELEKAKSKTIENLQLAFSREEKSFKKKSKKRRN